MYNELLTVYEVADILRITPNTIYRWLRAGKFPGVKIGKEWRIKREVVKARLENTPQTKELIYLDRLDNHCDHIMVVTSSASEVYDVEAEFFKEGLQQGQRLFKGCWWQDPNQVRKELTTRGINVNELENRNQLIIHDLSDAYKKEGTWGPVQTWLKEINKSLEMGYKTMWGSGSPEPNCCGDYRNLMEFKHLLNNVLENKPVVGICPYVYNSETLNKYNSLVDLIHSHKGLLFYHSGQGALLRN